METRIREVDGISIIDATGDFDLANAPKVRSAFDELINKKVPLVIMNFSGVKYIDSSGLATVIDAMQRTKKYQGKLALCGMNQVVKNVLEIARLDKVFAIYADETEALSKVKA